MSPKRNTGSLRDSITNGEAESGLTRFDSGRQLFNKKGVKTMKKKLLRPNQIITLRDYPVYNEQILKIYFRIFLKKQGRILPPSPVIHKSVGTPYVKPPAAEVAGVPHSSRKTNIKGNDAKSKRYNNLLRKFLEDNPRAEYFLIDGGHKSSAATLAHRLIPVFVLENDGDLKEARKLTSLGELFGWYDIGNSIKSTVIKLSKHHFGAGKFQTVEEKVRKMIQQKDIPHYMIRIYKR